MNVQLYINGQATGIMSDIHGSDGEPAHPLSLKGVGGPLVAETDTWEWR